MALSNAYLTRMPIGFPGMINRQDQCILQPEVLDGTNGPTAYGTFVKMTSGKICKLAGSEAATAIVGLIARPYPVQEVSTPSALGDPATPNLSLPGDVLKRGYIIVKFAGTTAAKGGQVNVCINTAGGGAIGDITETTDGNNVAVVNCVFMGPASGGMVEISYNIER